ncbi:hypothetical protein BBO99_00002302 [Phytophthora kernoviae]|uniref:Uncharacterized protein n=2 Tax=Phytophthora kernoviae TaxID=325452 RepID=A0A3F2RY90_9STRA|nr:hypothetical protein G195_002759 [Phytophthora kernoviae 00238/432]KAG2529770.1 hypothetical protein JM16_001934 [Phytophthora kernoviae]KAG2530987.1 hypothetical protein JM18_001923 [Phytophthora kernoviae]RLN06792.1 hypothetical protein BBI17_002164 [Phytophthora kernoviae]RLN62767.1 hypothetical protein BBJ29_006167 [Phytophthora kernoviae]
MELRNRATGRKQGDQGIHDVVLGPTIYSGERYNKMSERLRRQQKKPSEIADASVLRIMKPQLVGFVVALVFVLSLVFWMMYLAHVRRSNRKNFDHIG